MSTVPVTATAPRGCFGVACPKHAKCRLYALIENAPASLDRIGTCDERLTGERPLFVAVAVEAVA